MIQGQQLVELAPPVLEFLKRHRVRQTLRPTIRPADGTELHALLTAAAADSLAAFMVSGRSDHSGIGTRRERYAEPRRLLSRRRYLER